MGFEKYFLQLSNNNTNRALNLFMDESLSILEIEAILHLKHDEAKSAVLSLKEVGIIIEASGKGEIYIQFKLFDRFEIDNKLLYDYLRHEYKKDEQMQKDIKRLRMFKEKKITIEEIIADKDGVMRQLDRSM